MAFTLPESLGAVALQNKRVVYTLLFRAAAETLQRIAADPKHLGAEIGFLAVLHTWGQSLLHHPHLHCVVPGGGVSPDGQRWVPCRPGFCLPVRVLSRLFRRLFLHALQLAFDQGRLEFHGALAPLADPHAFARLLETARTGGGLSPDGQRWGPGRPGVCLPVRVRSRVVRRLCRPYLQGACDRGALPCHGPGAPLAEPAAFVRRLEAARATAWGVSATPPRGGPAPGLDSLGRSTHRGALAHPRWSAREAGPGTLRLTDSRPATRLTTLTLAAGECIRRFRLHGLPDGFVRIRPSGGLSHRYRAATLARGRARLGVPAALAPAPPAPPDGRTRCCRSPRNVRFCTGTRGGEGGPGEAGGAQGLARRTFCAASASRRR